jgi:hypothetical protein
MDERVEKAFAVVNYMATLSNQRRLLQEEYEQKLIYYTNGATFKLGPELLTFTKTVIDLGYEEDVAFVDANNFPIIIPNVKDFFEKISSQYFEVTNNYAAKYTELKTKRKISDIVEL